MQNTARPVGDEERGTANPFGNGGGVVSTVDEVAIASVSQHEPILTGEEKKVSPIVGVWRKFIPHGGLWSSALNLASATLGAGISSLPAGFNMSGIVMSSIYLVLVAVCTVYSLNLLAKVCVKTGVRNYGQAAEKVMGRFAGYYTAALMIVMCFGGSVAYIIIIGIILRAVLDRDGVPEYLKSEGGNRLLTSAVWLLIILPMCIPKQVNTLRHFSFLGVLFIVYFSGLVVGHSVDKIMKDGVAEDIVYMRTGNSALDGLSLFLFSYVCQPNAFEIFREMKHKTPGRFTLYGTVGMAICAVLYLLVGLFGYLEFGGKAVDTVLSLYDPGESIAVALAYIGVAAKVCVAFALHIIPMRDALYHCLKWNVDDVRYWKHSLIVTSITLLSLLVGLFIPKATTVFGLVGAFCGGHIGLVLPALFYMYSGGFTREKVGNVDFFGTYLLLFTGVVAVVFGTTSTIYNTLCESASANEELEMSEEPFVHGAEETQSGDVVIPSGDDVACPVQRGEGGEANNGKLSMLSALLARFIPHGGLWSSALNLASATLGAGICSLPAGFNMSGIVMSTICLVLVAVCTVYSLNLLAKVCVKTGVRNYGQAAERVMGRFAGYYSATLMILMCYGGNVSYIIVIGIILKAVLDRDGVPEYLKSEGGNRLLTSAVWLVIVFPMCIPKQVNSLRYFSLIGVISMVYFALFIVYHSAEKIAKDGVAEDIVYMRTGNSALGGLALYMFSYICQSNAFEIFREMKHKTPGRFTLYSTVGVVMCAVLYFAVGVLGYLEFGGKATDTVLSLYKPDESVAMALVYIGVAIKITVAFALHAIPIRDGVYFFMGQSVETVSCWGHILTVVIINLSALVIGLFIAEAKTVFGLVGAFCGGHISLVLPALFYMYSGGFTRERVGNVDFFGTYLLLFTGVVAVVFGTATTIYEAL